MLSRPANEKTACSAVYTAGWKVARAPASWEFYFPAFPCRVGPGPFLREALCAVSWQRTKHNFLSLLFFHSQRESTWL